MRSPRLRTRDALLCALVLLLLSYSWMFSKVSVPNERSRAYLTMAIVDDGVIAVDGPVARHGRVFDLSRFGEHYFTDKAPGASLLAVPVYALWRALQPPAAKVDVVDVINLARTWLMLPFGLLGFVLLRSQLRALRVSESIVDVSSLGFSLGSSMLHYSGAFYGHALVAVLALACVRCLTAAGSFGTEPPEPRARRLALIGAGACAGAAGLTEYQAVPLAALLAIPLLLGPTRLRDLGLYALGGAPFALGLLVYNHQAFGGAFALSYQHLVAPDLQDLHGSGLAGATRPSWKALLGLLFSEHRGLFPTAPLLGLGLGALLLQPRALPRALWITLLAAVAYFLSIVSASSVWYGGWSFGPRLLVPSMGLLAIAVGCGLNALASRSLAQLVCRSAAIAGVLYQHAVHAMFPELPPEFLRPLPDAVLPLWQARIVSPSLACKLSGLDPGNLIPLAVLVVCTVAVLALRGLTGRPVVVLGSLLGAAALLTLLAAAPASIDQAEQARFLKRSRGWQAAEQRCRL